MQYQFDKKKSIMVVTNSVSIFEFESCIFSNRMVEIFRIWNSSVPKF